MSEPITKYYVQHSGALVEVVHPEYASCPVYVSDDDYQKALAEIERLTRERDEWKEWHASMQALRDKHSASVDRLMAERERLRAALENIIATESVDNDGEPVPETGACFLARRALQEPKP